MIGRELLSGGINGAAQRVTLSAGNERTPAQPRLVCSAAAHEAMKSDDAQWNAMRLNGVQHVDAGDSDEPAYDLELRTCSCGSTLGRERAIAAPSAIAQLLILFDAVAAIPSCVDVHRQADGEHALRLWASARNLPLVLVQERDHYRVSVNDLSGPLGPLHSIVVYVPGVAS